MKRVILGVTGSIAAYKGADVVSALVKGDYDVSVVMTKAGAALVSPLTFQALTKNRVFSDVLQEDDPSQIIHVDLPQKHADILLIAPASANIIAKIAWGLADDMLSSMVLATPPSVPKLIAPAMNTLMYENPATQQNIETLKSRGWVVIEPRESRLACGYVGKGALALVETIVEAVKNA
ncbi:MAG: phosphopantothenoylcysteine decarboxylase [Oscillospiraceae bacterium]|nr:phosphopantothenoylcysteine decarboxylase [Oscillospiraceae bacterium]